MLDRFKNIHKLLSLESKNNILLGALFMLSKTSNILETMN